MIQEVDQASYLVNFLHLSSMGYGFIRMILP